MVHYWLIRYYGQTISRLLIGLEKQCAAHCYKNICCQYLHYTHNKSDMFIDLLRKVVVDIGSLHTQITGRVDIASFVIFRCLRWMYSSLANSQ